MDPITFFQTLTANGVTIEKIDVMSGRITLTKKFKPNDVAAYAAAESDVSIIYEVPQGNGSTWGTDGGSVGGAVGLMNGCMRLNRTGCRKPWLRLVMKAMAAPKTRCTRD